MTTAVTETTTVETENRIPNQQVREKVNAIRASWSALERAERALIGEARRDQLEKLLFGTTDSSAA